MAKAAGKNPKGKKTANLRHVEALSSRYFVGIDLGTTNSSVAYIDRLNDEGPLDIKLFNIPQVISPGIVAPLELLPSFFYFPAGFELGENAIKLPWDETPKYAVGHFARVQGALVPGRMVSSVKSWLCNSHVDRQKKILPWNKDNNMESFSPVEISAQYLAHIKNAWNHEISGGDSDYKLENQEIILTVPASFDDAARELTLKSAYDAGLKNVTLLEEPQAAFYYWIYKNKVDWADKLKDGDIILICDIGGGTTDFSLVLASKNKDNYLELKRIAVGEHILLGGDNMDMAVANHIETNYIKDGRRLDPLTWTSLCMKCRSLKEKLLGGNSAEASISISGRGKSIVGSTMKFTLKKDEITKIFIDGFLNDVNFDTINSRFKSAAGLRESGLPYADDPSISNHLARFLSRHTADISSERGQKFVHPNKILFNGGVFKSEIIKNRISSLVTKWVGGRINKPGDTEYSLEVLNNENLDLAVSLGAAYYAYSKSGSKNSAGESGVRIKSGSARSYYIGVENQEGIGQSDKNSESEGIRLENAVCIIPRGMDEGKKNTLNAGFQVLTNVPVQFVLYSSTTHEAAPGDLIQINDGGDFLKLPPLLTCLSYGKKSKNPLIDVNLSAYLSEIGTIDLYCVSKSSEHRWKLQFNFRKHEASAAQSDKASQNIFNENNETSLDNTNKDIENTENNFKNDGSSIGNDINNPEPKNHTSTQSAITEAKLKEAEALIENTFNNKTPDCQSALAGLIKSIETLFGARKEEWPLAVLRQLFGSILKTANTRTYTQAHEERWFNLAGFLLRPGFGAVMDDWRVKEALRVTFSGLEFKSNKNSIINWYVFLRRLAGGMTPGQQMELYNKTLKEKLFGSKKEEKSFKINANNQEMVELIRIAVNFELLNENEKTQLGNQIKKAIKRDGINPAAAWALSRVGARRLMYGESNYVLPAETVEKWIETLMEFDWIKEKYIPLSVIMMARVTGDRKIDISAETMSKIQKRLEQCPESDHLYDLLMNLSSMNDGDQKIFVGDSLPCGIILKK